MGSQTLEILRQGVWASLTGGWFYDPHQDLFCNTFHLYTWLFLFCLPFSLYIWFPPTLLIWSIYCVVIALVFTIIKILNARLHYMFDTSECIEESSRTLSSTHDSDVSSSKLDDHIRKGILKPTFRDVGNITIEMKELNSCDDSHRDSNSDTPPVQCSSRNSFAEKTPARQEFRHVDSLEYINKLEQKDIDFQSCIGTLDLKVDVHRKNSSGSSEDLQPVASNKKFDSESNRSPHSCSENRISNAKDSLNNAVTQSKDVSVKCQEVDEKKNADKVVGRSEDSIASTSSTSTSYPRGRQYSSYLPNLARSLTSSSSSTALLKGTGSFELGEFSWGDERTSPKRNSRCLEVKGRRSSVGGICGTASNVGDLKKAVRRTKSALETSQPVSSTHPPPSHPVSLEGISQRGNRVNFPGRSSDFFRRASFSELIKPIAEQNDEPQCCSKLSDHDEHTAGCSSGKHSCYGGKHKNSSDEVNRDASAETSGKSSHKDLTVTFSDNSIDQAYQAVLAKHFPERVKSSCYKPSVLCPDSASSHISSECDQSNSRSDNLLSRHGNDSNCLIKETKDNGNRVSSDSSSTVINCPETVNNEDNVSLHSNLNLNWLFDNGDDLVNNGCDDGSTNDTISSLIYSSEASSPTSPVDFDSEAATADMSTREMGAIPKRRPHVASQSGSSERPAGTVFSDNEAMNFKLSQRLLEILKMSTPAECERELLKLKQELEISTKSNSNPQGNSSESHTSNAGLSSKRKHLSSRRRRLPIKNVFTEKVNEDNVSNEECYSLLPSSRSQDTSSHENKSEKGELESVLTVPPNVVVGPGTHIANSHNDTSDGAVHCFQDEHGNWLTYTFDENSSGVATGLVPTAQNKIMKLVNNVNTKWDNSSNTSSSSGSTVILDSSTAAIDPVNEISSNSDSPPIFISNEELSNRTNNNSVEDSDIPRSMMFTLGQNQRSPLQLFAESLFTRAAAAAAQATGGTGTTEVNLSQAASSHGGTETEFSSNHKFRERKQKQQNFYYKLKIFPKFNAKVRFDRLALLALLDRNLGIMENGISIFLAIMVGVLGALVLCHQFHHDFAIFIFCVVMASCQYSLLKSVQPDASSPTHGYNNFVVFSRPTYFCICCSLILIVHSIIENKSFVEPIILYGFSISSLAFLSFIRDLLIYFVLFFPLIFSLGLLPQVNTFLIYLLEQLDIHLFGGNASTSLCASVVNITRSVLAVCVIYGFAYGALMEPKMNEHVLFSIFCGLLVAVSYHLSRCASDPYVLWSLIKSQIWIDVEEKESSKSEGEHHDPLPAKLQTTVLNRLKSDAIVCILIAILVFVVHVITVFISLEPFLSPFLYILTGVFGLVTHYIFPQLRKQLPWLCCSHPIFKPHEYDQFEAQEAAKLMWFEKIYVWLNFIEKNIIYPVLFLSALTTNSPHIVKRFGALWGSLVVVICGMKCFRLTFSDCSQHFIIVIFTYLFFQFDYKNFSESFLVDYFFMCILHSKFYDLLLKVRFVITYIAPWQITWGSAFHAFAQPFSVPHSAMLFVQAAISAILSTPLNPILGSAIFITSYVRPIKFWERDYNTKRVDHSNTRLSTHLERNPGADDNNLNSIFYEHLTRSLQHSLYGDLALGRWGNVVQGDCFVLASDNLNCLVHIIELGNGLVTFQMRGLEFRGTYCQQREVEAISEGIEEDDGCCCFEPGHLHHMLSLNAAFNQRWLAWELTATKYILEGYSVCVNNASSMLQVFDLRKVLITYYVKSIIYYTIKSSKLEGWLSMETILDALKPTLDKSYADLDPIFNVNIDEDYDYRASGVSRNSFCLAYLDWIQYCAGKREKSIECSRDSNLVSLCFALSLLGRRALGAASHNLFSSSGYFSVDFLLHGLHALFKGDFRITSMRDEWIFQDMELLKKVVSPGVRMSLKLHQDHFLSPFEYDDPQTLFHAISTHEKNLVISHEGDPTWRNAILSSVPSLFALRHVFDEGSDEYNIIMLNKRFLSFRVIKINRECVRGLWSGQQQELVYLRNRNPERGSIQNAKQALRNIINSSCDQPIGYPIYVSPLTTSYADTSQPLCKIIGGPLSLSAMKKCVINFWRRLRTRCGEGCSSGGTGASNDIYNLENNRISMHTIPPNVTGLNTSGSQSGESNIGVSASGSLGRGSVTGCSIGHSSLNAARGSMMSMVSGSASIIPLGKPSSSTLVSLAGILSGGTSDGSSGATSCSNVNLLSITPVNKPKDAVSNQLSKDVSIMDVHQVLKPRGGSIKGCESYLVKAADSSPHHHNRYCGEFSNSDRKSSRGSDRKIMLIKMDRFNEDEVENKEENDAGSGV